VDAKEIVTYGCDLLLPQGARCGESPYPRTISPARRRRHSGLEALPGHGEPAVLDWEPPKCPRRGHLTPKHTA
jgi:hypothetical protein